MGYSLVISDRRDIFPLWRKFHRLQSEMVAYQLPGSSMNRMPSYRSRPLGSFAAMGLFVLCGASGCRTMFKEVPYDGSTDSTTDEPLTTTVYGDGTSAEPEPDTGVFEDTGGSEDGNVDGGADDGSVDGGSGEGEGSDGGADGGGSDAGADDGGADGGGSDSGGSGTDGGTGGASEGDTGGGTGEVLLPTEDCNGIDDDGDGEIDEGACPDTVVTEPITGHAYMVVETAMQWFDAQAYCASYGYTLVTIDDATENDFVWELVFEGTDGVGSSNTYTWMGLHEDVGASWEWDSGASLGFDAWSSSVITDSYGTSTYGQAAAFADESSAAWSEVPQTWFYSAVCETP